MPPQPEDARSSSLRSQLFVAVNLIAGLALLAIVLRAYGSGALGILKSAVSVPLLLAFLASAAATIVCLSLRWGYILAGLVPPPALWLLCFFRSAAHGLAVLVPSGKLGGDPLRAWFAVRARVEPGYAVASVAVDRAVEMGSTAPFSILFATLLLQAGIPQLEQVLLTVVVGTAGLGVGVIIAVRRLRRGAGLVAALVRHNRLDRLPIVNAKMDILEQVDQSAAEFVEQRSRIGIAFVMGIVANFLVILEFWLLLAALGLPTTPIAIVAAIFATGAAHMAPVPAGIGVIEAAQMWTFEMLGYSPDVGLAVGLAVRMRELVWILPGLLYGVGRSLGVFRGRFEAGRR